MTTLDDMKSNLNGMYFEDIFDFKIPTANSTKEALFIYQKNLPTITWHFMSSLENNPTNLPQTETILKGQSVGGIDIYHLMQVKNYGDAAYTLIELLKTNNFKLDKKTASTLHAFAGKEDAFEWGIFRHSDVFIGGIDYTPPKAQELEDIAIKGFHFIENKILSPQTQAIVLFLFMARNQFFYDANKRTASLMMNGHLLKNGVYPITVFENDSEDFHTKLSQFYNTGDATQIMKFFESAILKMYPNNMGLQEDTGSKNNATEISASKKNKRPRMR